MSETVTEAPTTTEAPSGGDDLAEVLGRAYDENMAAQVDAEQRRDERGRFAARQQDGEAAEDAPAEPTDRSQDRAPTNGAPESWTEAERAVWEGLSPDARDVIARREADRMQAIQERDELAKVAVPFQEVLRPYEKFHAMAGIQPVEAVRRLLAAQDALNKDFLGSLPVLIRQQGYDPIAVAQAMLGSPQVQQQQVQQPPPYDPRVDQILAHQALSQIEAFKSNPEYPHFEAVRYEMGRLIEANPSLTMQEAYERAVWSDPKIRPQLVQDEAKKAADAAAKKAAAEAAKKARAGVSVRDSSPSNGSAARPQSAGSIDDDIRAAIEKVGWA